MKLGGTRPPQPSPNAIARHSERQARLAELPAGAVDVLMFLRMVALVFDARRSLLIAVERRRTLERQLADPALADHPKRPQAERRLAERWEDERLATIRLAEDQVRLAILWDRLAASDKNRYALITLIGEPDPKMPIDTVLWCDDRGLSRLVPYPDDWAPAHDIAHIAFNPDRHGVQTYDRDELLRAESAPF